MTKKNNLNCQDLFLNTLRKNKVAATIFLSNGIKLQGMVTGFDNFAVLLRRDAHIQLVYKHSISTIMPNGPFSLRLDEEDDDIEASSIVKNEHKPIVEIV